MQPIVDRSGVMSTAVPGLAEIYVMRKMHKEKMKSPSPAVAYCKADECADDDNWSRKKRSTTNSGNCGCFSMLMFQKIHPRPAAADP